MAFVMPSFAVEPATRIIAPYFTLERFGRIPRDIWRVVVVTDLPGVGMSNDAQTAVVCHSSREPDARYRFDGRRRLLHVERPAKDEWVPHTVARLARVLLRLQYAERRAVFLHGGLVRARHGGVAFIGGKRTGKTSSILSFLATQGGGYVTNDDLAVMATPSGWCGLGWPRSVSARPDTLAAVMRSRPGLRIPAAASSHPANPGSMPHREDGDVEAALLYPSELCHCFGCSLHASANVHMIVFPEFEPAEKRGAALEPLHAREAVHRLRVNLESDPNHNYETFLLPCFAVPTTEELHAQAEQLARDIPSYVLRQSMWTLREGTTLVATELARLAPKGMDDPCPEGSLAGRRAWGA